MLSCLDKQKKASYTLPKDNSWFNMSQISILVLGKRGGILQWFENVLDAQSPQAHYQLSGFALNHNNWYERLIKKLLKFTGHNIEQYTAALLRKKIQTINPDIILITDLFYFGKPILEVLQQTKPNAKIYHWIGDFFDARLADSKDIIDSYLFTDSTFIEDAKKIGIKQSHYFPLAVNSRIFTPPPENTVRKSELLFVGAWSESRQQLLEQVEFPVTVYGKGWDKLASEHIHTHPYNIPLNQVAQLYQQYSYVLNIINKTNTRIGLNMRCFEVPAAGAILVTEYSDDLKNCFDIKNDIVYFNTYEELRFKLHDPSLFSVNAQKTCHYVQQQHSYEKRLISLIDMTK